MSEPRPAGRERTLVIIPTYNEFENIERIIARTRAAVSHADILIADDNSPDGTGKLADALAAADDHIHVMHRLGKEGLGAAYLAGFEWGINNDYDILVEMDADGSHQPEQLPLLLRRHHERGPGAGFALGRGRQGGELAQVPRVVVSGWQSVDTHRVGDTPEGCHRWLSRLPPPDAARYRPG